MENMKLVIEFSSGDKKGNDKLNIDGYVTTPDGSLQKYDVKTKKESIITTDLPSDPKDPDRKNTNASVDIPKEIEYQKTNTPQKKREDSKNSLNNYIH